MIKEAYCSYEVSKLLKEKGFDEKTTHWYNIKGNLINDYPVSYENFFNPEKVWLAPTHQMACAWLREKHHIHANPIKQGNYDDCSDYYTWIVASNGTIHKNQSVADKLSYDDAVEEALKYTLENLL